MVGQPKRKHEAYQDVGSLTNYKIGCTNINASQEDEEKRIEHTKRKL